MNESIERERHRGRMQAHRQRRRESGLRQTMIWLPQEATNWIEAAVHEGKFRNRSEAVSAAVEQFFASKGND